MAYFHNSSDINQTFIIEPIYITGNTPSISACTFVYTNALASCSGDTTIFMGSGVISFDGNIYTNDSLTADAISATTISATTFYGDGSNLTGISIQDTMVTGGTYSDGSVVFTDNTGGTFSVSGFSTGYTLTTSAITQTLGYVPLSAYTDTRVTGATLSGTTIIFDRNDLLNAYSVDISPALPNPFDCNDLSGCTIIQDIQNDINNKVPYTGATSNVQLGEFGVDTGFVQFDLTTTQSGGIGKLNWNNTDGTLDLGLKGGDVTLQLGQEQVVRVVNKTNSNLLESQYKVVRVRTQAEGGAQGQRLAVKLAQADTKAHHSGVLGLVTENINDNQEGFITTFGHVRGINTTGSLQGETWLDGDTLWLSEVVPGGLTNIEPSNHPVQMGYVEYAHANNGKIFVKVEEGVTELHELHDVNLSGTTDGQVLTYENGEWVNKTPIIPSSSLTIGSTQINSGATGNILFQSGTTLQQSSNLFWDTTNSRLAIGSSNPQARLDVRAQGNSYLDLAFVVRNNSNTYNILQVDGSGSVFSSGSGDVYSNTAYGQFALNKNTTANFNTAFGSEALRNHLTGNNNTAVGANSLVSSTSGSDNTAYGFDAIRTLSTGSGNVGIGGYVLRQTNTGYNNTSIGLSSMSENTSGFHNVAVGENSLRGNRTGSENVAIGRSAGRYITGGSVLAEASTNSIFIGSLSKPSGDSQTNQIVIGYNSVGLGSNTTVVGNTSTTLFRPYGNVAIGADTAQARLDVRAQGALSTDIAFRVRNSANTVDLFALNGNSSWISRNNSNSNQYIYWNGTNRLELKNDTAGESTIGNNHGALGLGGATGLRLAAGNKGIYIYNSGNFYIGNATGIQAGSGQGNILFVNNTAPTSNIANHHYYYSADIVEGNAAPHFRTENGRVVKLYQQVEAALANTANTGDANTDALIEALKTIIINAGLGAAI